MTTLELARRVAHAARHPIGDTTPAEAVLAELDRNRCWFCRIRDVDGITEDTPMPHPVPRGQVQPSLLEG